MDRHVQVVTTQAHPGTERQFNVRYDTVHIPEILRLRGVMAAQRFVIADPVQGAIPRYLAIYELETDDLDETLLELGAALDTMTMSDALDVDSTVMEFHRPLGSRSRA